MDTVNTLSNRDKVIAVLTSIQTGDPAAFGHLHPTAYRQHNLDLADGLAGIAEVVGSQPVGTFRARVVRAFADGDHVVAHTEYDFFAPLAGFDVFRFEDGLIVEHWDNLQPLTDPNLSGHTLLDGATEVTDRDRTEENKRLVETFFRENVLGHAGRFADYIDPNMVQHNPTGADGLAELGAMMQRFTTDGHVMRYDTIHKVLGEGDFVLLISEGVFGPDGGAATAFYDLFRVADGRLVEHWDVLQPIPPREQWRNDNGKF